MSLEPEDSLLEALRNDLPSSDSSARVRRRLLAAGVAVGNGVAVTTAAASGATPGVVSGLVAKVAALSWGIKVGALAVVAIPTVGLLVDQVGQPSPALVAPAQARAPLAQPRLPEGPGQAPESLDSRAIEPGTPERALPRSAPVPAAGPSREAESSGPSRPSQVDFAASDSGNAPKASSTLADETRLLDGAFSELAAGNAALAAELIAEHQRRFPSGLLEKERERARARLNEISRGK